MPVIRALRVILALAGVLALACGSDAPAEGAERPGQGVVKNVDPVSAEVTIDHGDIPGLMKAMTMTFEVEDVGLLQGVAPGDAVDFRVKYEDGRYVVTELRGRP